MPQTPRVMSAGLVRFHTVLERTGAPPAERVMVALLDVLESDQTTLVTQFVGYARAILAAKTETTFDISVAEMTVSDLGRHIRVRFLAVSGWGGETVTSYTQNGNLAFLELPAVMGGVYATAAQGAKADSAVQIGTNVSLNTTISLVTNILGGSTTLKFVNGVLVQ